MLYENKQFFPNLLPLNSWDSMPVCSTGNRKRCNSKNKILRLFSSGSIIDRKVLCFQKRNKTLASTLKSVFRTCLTPKIQWLEPGGLKNKYLVKI